MKQLEKRGRGRGEAVPQQERRDAARSPRSGRAARGPLPLELMRFSFRVLGPVLPDAMGALAFRLWFRTTRRREHPAEAAIVRGAEQRTLTWRGRALATYSWGSGPTVLLVHGWNGRAAQLAPLVPALTGAGYRVIAFDAPAHGRTPGRRTNVYEVVEALQVVREAYGPVATVAAHSFGALATAMAVERGVLSPQRVVCFAPAVTREPLANGFAEILRLPATVRQTLERRIDAFAPPAFWAGLTIDRPVLVVHDRDDEDIPFADGAALRHRWPDARLVATRGLGHRGVLRDPGVAEHVVEFLRT